jgi:threonine synthase
MDPHTACGVVAAERALPADGPTPQIVLSTAHPAKFPDAIAAITGKRPALPERLSGLLTAHERFTAIDNNLAAAERHVEIVTRATCEGPA